MKISSSIIKSIFIIGFFALAIPIDRAQSLDITQSPDSVAAESNRVGIGSDKRSTKMKVRNLIKDGNRLYHEKRYSEAEISYAKALELDPNSEIAQFNLASALLKNSGNSDPSAPNNPLSKATQMLQNLISTAQNAEVVEKSLYDLGNIAFNQQNYSESIDMYKHVLRRNPDNNAARQNLRLAQLKQQENQNQNQDQNQDNNQDQNKDQNQDQDQNQQQQPQNQDKDQQQQNQQQQPQMSDANAEKILKAMENAEAATRKRVEAQKAKEQQSNRRTTTKPW